MPCSVDFSGKSALLWREKEEECIWGRGELWGTGKRGGGEPAVSMYCMREEQFFSKDINEKKERNRKSRWEGIWVFYCLINTIVPFFLAWVLNQLRNKAKKWARCGHDSLNVEEVDVEVVAVGKNQIEVSMLYTSD